MVTIFNLKVTSRHNLQKLWLSQDFPFCSLIRRLLICGTYNPVILNSNVCNNDVILVRRDGRMTSQLLWHMLSGSGPWGHISANKMFIIQIGVGVKLDEMLPNVVTISHHTSRCYSLRRTTWIKCIFNERTVLPPIMKLGELQILTGDFWET